MDYRTFIRDIAHAVRCDERRAEGLAVAVLQELRNRLTHEEVKDVAAQLPRQLKQVWLEGESEHRPFEKIHKAELIGRVRRRCSLPDDTEAERAVRAVFAELKRLLGSPSGREGEAWDVYSQLPKDLKEMWLEATAGDGE